MLTPITDGFIAVAEEHGRYLREVERFPPHKVFVIPNGVDTDRFRPCPPDETLRRQLGLLPRAPVVGIVAALRPEKDHELFLRVAARVLDNVADTHFLVVGDGDLRPRLERVANELGIGAAVHFLGTRSDIPELLSLVDVSVLTSKMEASPVTILEAMACAKPCVAPRIGSIPETIVDGQNGHLTSPGDEAGSAQAIVRLLTDPARLSRFGQHAHRHVQERFSLERMVEGYQQLIAGLHAIKTARGARL
jgi:glycosyltransferase involved in cell wall biosynthesis